MTNFSLALATMLATIAQVEPRDHLVFGPPPGTGNSRHVVLISGDEEYRSEETCPMLAKILSQRHGFRCTVLFAIDKQHGFINPNENANIPGLDVLDSADVMIIGTRFRDLPDEQLAPILKYLEAAKPVIGFRTATHAFKTEGNYGGFDWNNFGLNVIGENWVRHHGDHKLQGGRGVIEEAHAQHPLLRGVLDVFTLSDIYAVENINSSNATILLRGAVTESLAADSKPVDDARNHPMMPLAWLRTYQAPSGKTGQAFATTAGAAVDFSNEDLRRLIVNATLHLTGLAVPERADVTPVDPFAPSFYGFIDEPGYFQNRNLRVSDFALGSSANTTQPASDPSAKQ